MTQALDWTRIDTVLCDMDGTVLDLSFDHAFWHEAVPRAWGQQNNMELSAAQEALRPLFVEHQGTLNWYCLDFWDRTLGLRLRELKQESAADIRFLPQVQPTLQAIRNSGRELVLLTNAHPDVLRLKDRHSGLIELFDRAYSTHPFGAPKEQLAFWQSFAAQTGIDLARAVLVDDTPRVLRGALAGGVGQVLGVRDAGRALPIRAAEPDLLEISSLAALQVPA